MVLQVRYLNSEVQSRDLRKLCASPDDAFTEGQVMIKDDGTTTLRRLRIDIGEVVVKRYNTKNAWHLIRRNFQRSRAENCFVMSKALADRNIRVPESLAAVKDCHGPLSGRSWYISRYQPGEHLLGYLDLDAWQERFQEMMGQVTDFFRVMVDAGFSHGDMKATNLLVSEGSLFVIDLDATRQHRFSFSHRRALRRDRARFLKNWKGRQELSDAFSDQLDAAGMP